LISSLIFFILSIIVGFRDVIGSDYGGYYLDYIYMEDNYSLYNNFKTQNLDLIYEYLSFFLIFLNLPFDFLNLLIGSILIYSVLYFANKEKDYLIIVLIFLSYHYLVLGMGYTRQGLSIAFIFFYIHFWRNEKLLLSFVFIILAVLSHKFAIVSAFLIFIRPKGSWFYFNKYFYLILLSSLIFLFINIFENKSILDYYNVYALEHSFGSSYRTLGYALCSLLFFSKKSLFKKRLDYRYLYLSSIVLIGLFFLSFIFSTISDRVANYFLPSTFIILSNIQYGYKNISHAMVRIILIIGLFSHLFFWTNFSNQSKYYVPYRMIDYPGIKPSPYKNVIKYCC
tara:strand:- start:7929 stop:8945 length:1017 start_codon:yes stop_codon:yes gene_type:complete